MRTLRAVACLMTAATLAVSLQILPQPAGAENQGGER